jgi:uncharacterized protein YkwD
VQRVQHTFTSLVVLAAWLGFVGFVGGSPASAGTSYANKVESSAITSTNQRRIQHDRRSVRGNACLDRMAESWARHLAQSNTLTHRNMNTILSQCNRSYVSENLAKYPVSSGMTAAQVARGTVKAWMESAGHRRNLLSRPPRVIGLGVAKSANGDYWVVVQNFAR